ncbi:MAG: type 1 glutamine amidotransferase [Phormidesmis sp.]
MKIHYLQHVPFEGLASIEPWAIKRNHLLSATKFFNNEPLPLVEDIDWLIVMGGPMNIYEDEKYPWLTEEKRFIERAIEQDKTVVGICLGSQLIADVLGAKVYQGQYKEIGWFPIQMTDVAKKSSVFSSLPQNLTVFHWHGDTFNLPKGATHLAYSEGCQNQAFSYNQKVLGLQFHLESTKDSVQQIIKNCTNELAEGKYIQKPEEMLPKDDDFSTINNVMSRILSNLSGRSAD